MKKLLRALFLIFTILTTISCQNNKKVWAWCSGKTSFTPEKWEEIFSVAEKTGIDAIILECHGGYPEILTDTLDCRDSAAIQIIKTALPYAHKHNIELHAWIWTTNRTELSWRRAHPDYYQVNAKGESCLDIKLYNREHYRWLCPSREENLEYMKERVRELAAIEGLAGIHLDFIRYPDVILPYALQESRGVVQDKVYPQWDFCYCDECRRLFKEQTGIDPIDLEDPTSNEAWMQFRFDAMSHFASEIAAEIQRLGKISSAAVFASPAESKKLVRQDWANYRNFDFIFPMLYHKYYGWNDEMVEIATKQGVDALKEANNDAILCTGLFTWHVPQDRIGEFLEMTNRGGSKGICFFSLEGIMRKPDYADSLATALKSF